MTGRNLTGGWVCRCGERTSCYRREDPVSDASRLGCFRCDLMTMLKRIADGTDGRVPSSFSRAVPPGTLRSTGCLFARTLLTIVTALFVAGCNCAPVARDISQHEANQVVALLNSAGISSSAEMEKGGRGRYRVDAQCSRYGQSISILASYDLPRPPRPASELLSQQSFLPGSRQFELLRVDHALGLELEDLIRGIPAVEDARVVVRYRSVMDGAPPGVAASVQVRPGKILDSAAVLPLMQRTVPGVTLDQITLSVGESSIGSGRLVVEGALNTDGQVVRVPLVPFFAWRVVDDDYSGLALTFIGAIIVMGFAGVGIGFYFGGVSIRAQSRDAAKRDPLNRDSVTRDPAGMDRGTRPIAAERPRKTLPEIS
jgi:type III secretory pathway lipoprotein EscJ